MNIAEFLTRSGKTETLNKLNQTPVVVVTQQKSGWDLREGEKEFCRMVKFCTDFTAKFYSFFKGEWTVRKDAEYKIWRIPKGGDPNYPQYLVLRVKRFELCYEVGNLDSVIFRTRDVTKALNYLIDWKEKHAVA